MCPRARCAAEFQALCTPAPLFPITQHKPGGVEQTATSAGEDATRRASVSLGMGVVAMGLIVGKNSIFY